MFYNRCVKIEYEGKMNSKTQNQKFWQIIIPFFSFFILTSIFGYTLLGRIFKGEYDLRMWSDISVVVFFLPVIGLFCIGFFGIIFMIMLANKSQKGFKRNIPKLRNVGGNILYIFKKLAELSIQPFLFVEFVFGQFIKNK